MQRINLNDQVARELGLRVIRGEFAPGEALPTETELAVEFGVSRPVVREGLRQLVSKGMVEARQKRGTIVCPTNEWNHLDSGLLAWFKESGRLRPYLTDLVEIRLMVEPNAAAMAAERATPDQIAALRGSIDAMVASEADTSRFLEADVAFHHALLRASGNVFLVSILGAIETALRESVAITNRPGTDNARSTALHRKVVDAVADGDSDGARIAMVTLLGDARAALKRALNN